jgi:hypothetical protein
MTAFLERCHFGMKNSQHASKSRCKLSRNPVRSDLNCSEKIKKEQIDFGFANFELRIWCHVNPPNPP